MKTEILKSPEPEAQCCNSPKELTLHEQLEQRIRAISRETENLNVLADGFRTLHSLLPQGITLGQQDAIRQVLVRF